MKKITETNDRLLALLVESRWGNKKIPLAKLYIIFYETVQICQHSS